MSKRRALKPIGRRSPSAWQETQRWMPPQGPRPSTTLRLCSRVNRELQKPHTRYPRVLPTLRGSASWCLRPSTFAPSSWLRQEHDCVAYGSLAGRVGGTVDQLAAHGHGGRAKSLIFFSLPPFTYMKLSSLVLLSTCRNSSLYRHLLLPKPNLR